MSRAERVEAASKAMLWSETMGRSSLDEMADAGVAASDALLRDPAAMRRVARAIMADNVHAEDLGLWDVPATRERYFAQARAAVTALLDGAA